MPSDPYMIRQEAERLIAEDRVPTDELARLVAAFGPSEKDAPGTYALVVAVEASNPEEAWEFVKGMLVAEIRWDHPLKVPYIGAPWEGIPKGTTEMVAEGITLGMTYPKGENYEHGVKALTPCG